MAQKATRTHTINGSPTYTMTCSDCHGLGERWDRATKRMERCNHCTGEGKLVVPLEPGMPATLCYPDDRYPYVVCEVSPSGHRIGLLHIDEDKCEGMKEPQGHCNGFPVFDFCVSAEELKDLTIRETDGGIRHAYRRKDGHFYYGGSRMALGYAQYRRNYAD